MELSEIFDFLQPCSSQMVKDNELESNNSMIPLSQSAVSNENKMLLQVLFPSEDTIKTHLYPGQHNESDSNIYSDQLDNSSNNQLRPIRSQFDQFNPHDLVSLNIYSEILSELVFNLVHQNNTSLEALDYIEYGNSNSLYEHYQYYDDYQASRSNQLFTYNDYVKLRANTLLLARLGYKLTLTLNTDNDKVKETWNPNVAQKMLAVEYSPLNVKKDYAPTKAPLDQFESLLLAEVLCAFQDYQLIEVPYFSTKTQFNPSPAKFISICRKIISFRKLHKNDRIVLFSNTLYGVTSMNTIFKYNQSTDDWTCSEYGTRFGRRDLFLLDRLLHDLFFPVIEKFPDRWRRDETVEALLFLIIIFNPDQAGLLQPDRVRYEQYVYIHLLKRYSELVCESPCDASDNLYRLMVGVEHSRELGEIVRESLDSFEVGFCRSLRNWTIDVIDCDRF